MGGRRTVRPLLAVVLVAVLSSVASVARADDQALVRVIAEAASVRTGPGFGYRTVYRANQGEVLTVIGRATHDHWFRVELPDGTYGWVLGDEVFPLDVDMAAAHEGPSIWRRMSHAVFSPSRQTCSTMASTGDVIHRVKRRIRWARSTAARRSADHFSRGYRESRFKATPRRTARPSGASTPPHAP